MPTLPPKSRPSSRAGFSLVELLFAITIAGILMALAYPKMGPMRDRAGLRSARQVVAGHIATARQAAIRRGTSATFHVDGNALWVSSNGGVDTVAARHDLLEQHGVTMVTPLTAVTYNARGLARVTATPRYIKLERGNATDSVCVNILGALGRCGL